MRTSSQGKSHGTNARGVERSGAGAEQAGTERGEAGRSGVERSGARQSAAERSRAERSDPLCSAPLPVGGAMQNGAERSEAKLGGAERNFALARHGAQLLATLAQRGAKAAPKILERQFAGLCREPVKGPAPSYYRILIRRRGGDHFRWFCLKLP